MATPSAAKATAAKASAASQIGVRLQPRSRKATSTASMTAASTQAQRPASPIFSASSPVRDTRPRTRRPNACSSRSSASIPAASSTVTNISESTTATSTPNTSSAVSDPESACSRTRTGLAIEARIGFDTSRLSAASRAKRETCCRAARVGASSGIAAIAASMMCWALRSPRMSTFPTSGSETFPPSTIRLR